MAGKNDSRLPINRPVAFWGGVLVSGMGLALTALSVWALGVTHRDYAEAIQEGVPILLEDTGITAMYLAPVVYMGLALFGLCGVVVAFRGKAFVKAVSDKLNKVVALLLVTGVVGMLLGSYVANKLWAEHFQNHGYVECSQPFLMTGKWFTSVWVDSVSLCDDRRVLKLFGAGKHVSYINSVVEESRS